MDTFIHSIYKCCKKNLYKCIFISKDILPLEIQKNNRELELIIKESILNTVRDNIPIDNLLKMYLDETQETEVEIEETREVIPDEEEIKKKKKKKKVKNLKISKWN